MMNAGRNSAERESEAEFIICISVCLALTLYCIFSVCKKRSISWHQKIHQIE